MIVYFYLLNFERKITVTKYFPLLFIFLIFTSCTKRSKELSAVKIFSSTNYTNLTAVEKVRFLDSLSNDIPHFKLDTAQSEFLFSLSNEYYYLSKIDKSMEVSKKALTFAKRNQDTVSLARAYFYIADCFEADKRDSAYYYYHKAEKFYSSQGQFEKVANTLFKKAYLLFYEGNYLESEIEVSKALQLIKESDNHQLLFSCYVLLGYNFERLEEYDSALYYFKLSKVELDILKKSNIEFEQMNNYTANYSINLANVYDQKFDYERSVRALESVKTDSLKAGWPRDYASVVGNLGYSKMQLGQLDEAYQLFTESLALSRKLEQQNNVMYQMLNLGCYYILLSDTTRAVSHLKEANRLAEELHSTDEIKKCLTLLRTIDGQNSDFYNQRYISLSDSLIKTQRIKRNKFARIEYETSVLEDKNKILHNERYYLVLISCFLLLSLLTFIVYRYFNNQKMALEFRKQQQNAEEEIFSLLKEHQIELQQARALEQNRISRELHDGVMNRIYGVRLQLGILNANSDSASIQKRFSCLDLLQELEEEVRIISHDLHSDADESILSYEGLLVLLVEKQNELGIGHYDLQCDEHIDWEEQNGLLKINFFRIIQESLQNVAKYANASYVSIKILKNEQHLQLEISDDGIGFDTEANKESGIGLKNIKARVAVLKGTFLLESAVGNGTKILVTVTV